MPRPEHGVRVGACWGEVCTGWIKELRHAGAAWRLEEGWDLGQGVAALTGRS